MVITRKQFYSRDPGTVTERILDAAEAEFMSCGYAEASTNRVLERFGGSKATLFRHYPTKAWSPPPIGRPWTAMIRGFG
jgi:AcrR family transcriptional regulator